MVNLIKEFKYTYMFVVPNFELSDAWSRPLDAKFLLDTRLWNLDGILRYSDNVRHAVWKLSELSDKKTFIEIAKILAFGEMQRNWNHRIHPIWWWDITDLTTQQRELN